MLTLKGCFYLNKGVDSSPLLTVTFMNSSIEAVYVEGDFIIVVAKTLSFWCKRSEQIGFGPNLDNETAYVRWVERG